MKSQTVKTFMALLAGLGFFLAAGVSLNALGNETTGEKIESKMDETGKDMKKSGRKLKRKVRNATGRGSLGKDLKDAGNDVSDDIDTGAKKLKRKVD